MTTTTGILTGAYWPAGRSRGELRTLIARVFGHHIGTATSDGTTTTLNDTRLSRYADDFFVGAQVWVKWKPTSAAGYTAYVTDFASSTGTLTFTPAMDAATESGDAYEIFRYVTKDDIEIALNEVCKGGLARHDLTVNTDGSLSYSLNAIAGLHRPSQLVQVWRHRLGDETTLPQVMTGWRLENNRGELTLWLPWAPDTSDALWIVYEMGELGFAHDDDKTSMPVDVIKARAVLWLLGEMLIGQDEQGLAKFGQLTRYWRERLMEAEQALPRPRRMVVQHQWSATATASEQPFGALGVVQRYAS